MDIHLKKKVLKQLALKNDDAVIETLNIEADKINESLSIVNDYAIIEEQLELLDSFAFRLHDKSISILIDFLDRINNISFTFKNNLGIPIVELRKYQNSDTLIIRVLELLEHIRYFDVDRILSLFLAYSVHENNKVSKKAAQCIDSISEYNLDIVYGGENNPAYGTFAQDAIINHINLLSTKQKTLYFTSIISICRSLLSSSVSGTSSTYNKVTWSTAPIQANQDFAHIRTSAIKILKEQYKNSSKIEQKFSVINTLYSAIHTPSRGKYGNDLLKQIYADLKQVLQFYNKLINEESLQIVQKIEHQCFWIYRNRSNDAIKHQILKIKKDIDANEEYRIYKILIGFEGIFEDWEIEDVESGKTIEKEKNYRSEKALHFAKSINEDVYDEWSNRILLYTETDSNDLATFPYFGEFLERFGEVSPDLAIRLIKDNEDSLERFFVAILVGVWRSDKATARKLISSWVNESKYLFSCASLFEFNSDLDEELLNEIFVKSVAEKEEYTLIPTNVFTFCKL